MIDLAASIKQMEAGAAAIAAMVARIGGEQARWKPDAETWSVLEVVNHLYDEEREDFRVRLQHILDGAEGLPPGINPPAWVIERGYNQRDLGESLADFQREREASLDWLRALDSPDWEAFIEGPFGRIRAGDMLAAWVAHDLLHLRQLVELRYAYLAATMQPYQLIYAGEW